MKANHVPLCALCILMFTSIVFSQPATMRGSSSIELNLGLWNHFNAGSQLSSLGVQQEAKSGGFVGGVTYSYWTKENVAVTVSASLIAAQATSSVTAQTLSLSSLRIPIPSVNQSTNSIVSALLGIRYYLSATGADDAIRPYVAVSAGSYMGYEASNSLFAQSAHSESAFGGRLGAGLDFFLGQSVKLGLSAGYNAMTDFSVPVGARTNYNGVDASMGIGFLF